MVHHCRAFGGGQRLIQRGANRARFEELDHFEVVEHSVPRRSPICHLSGLLLVVVSVVGSVAGFAAWFEFVGDGVTGLGEGWDVVEVEEVC